MTGYDSSEDQRPLTYINGHPIYATTLLVGVHVLTMVLTALIHAFHGGGLLAALAFSSPLVFKGWIWQFVTYAFLNGPSLWFAIEMILLFRFGRDVEQFLGRRSFLRMYALLLLLPPAVLTLVGAFTPTSLQGSWALHFAIFVAFAVLYPGATLLFGITARWGAAILLGIYTLQGLASGALAMLITVWVTSAVAALYIGHERGHFQIPSFAFWRKQPNFYVVRSENFREEDTLESIDPLLEKISKSGLASLTRKERAQLEKARAELIKKESPPK